MTLAPAALSACVDVVREIVGDPSRLTINGAGSPTYTMHAARGTAANDIALYRELMRRGVSEYLVGPIQPLQIIQAIAGLYVNPDKPFVFDF